MDRSPWQKRCGLEWEQQGVEDDNDGGAKRREGNDKAYRKEGGEVYLGRWKGENMCMCGKHAYDKKKKNQERKETKMTRARTGKPAGKYEGRQERKRKFEWTRKSRKKHTWNKRKRGEKR